MTRRATVCLLLGLSCLLGAGSFLMDGSEVAEGGARPRSSTDSPVTSRDFVVVFTLNRDGSCSARDVTEEELRNLFKGQGDDR